MHSIKVKVEQPNIFDMGSNLFPKNMWAAFILSCMGLILGLIFGTIHLANGFRYTLSSNDFFGIIFIMMIGLMSPLILIPEIFRGANLKVTLSALLVLPSIFLMMILGGFSGFFMAKRMLYWKAFNSGLDWIVLLKRVLIRNGYPIQIIQFATARCNLRCVHCFYKESLDAPNPGELDQKIFNQLAEETKPLLWYGFAEEKFL